MSSFHAINSREKGETPASQVDDLKGKLQGNILENLKKELEAVSKVEGEKGEKKASVLTTAKQVLQLANEHLRTADEQNIDVKELTAILKYNIVSLEKRDDSLLEKFNLFFIRSFSFKKDVSKAFNALDRSGEIPEIKKEVDALFAHLFVQGAKLETSSVENKIKDLQCTLNVLDLKTVPEPLKRKLQILTDQLFSLKELVDIAKTISIESGDFSLDPEVVEKMDLDQLLESVKNIQAVFRKALSNPHVLPILKARMEAGKNLYQEALVKFGEAPKALLARGYLTLAAAAQHRGENLGTYLAELDMGETSLSQGSVEELWTALQEPLTEGYKNGYFELWETKLGVLAPDQKENLMRILVEHYRGASEREKEFLEETVEKWLKLPLHGVPGSALKRAVTQMMVGKSSQKGVFEMLKQVISDPLKSDLLNSDFSNERALFIAELKLKFQEIVDQFSKGKDPIRGFIAFDKALEAVKEAGGKEVLGESFFEQIEQLYSETHELFVSKKMKFAEVEGAVKKLENQLVNSKFTLDEKRVLSERIDQLFLELEDLEQLSDMSKFQELKTKILNLKKNISLEIEYLEFFEKKEVPLKELFTLSNNQTSLFFRVFNFLDRGTPHQGAEEATLGVKALILSAKNALEEGEVELARIYLDAGNAYLEKGVLEKLRGQDSKTHAFLHQQIQELRAELAFRFIESHLSLFESDDLQLKKEVAEQLRGALKAFGDRTLQKLKREFPVLLEFLSDGERGGKEPLLRPVYLFIKADQAYKKEPLPFDQPFLRFPDFSPLLKKIGEQKGKELVVTEIEWLRAVDKMVASLSRKQNSLTTPKDQSLFQIAVASGQLLINKHLALLSAIEESDEPLTETIGKLMVSDDFIAAQVELADYISMIDSLPKEAQADPLRSLLDKRADAYVGILKSIEQKGDSVEAARKQIAGVRSVARAFLRPLESRLEDQKNVEPFYLKGLQGQKLTRDVLEEEDPEALKRLVQSPEFKKLLVGLQKASPCDAGKLIAASRRAGVEPAIEPYENDPEINRGLLTYWESRFERQQNPLSLALEIEKAFETMPKNLFRELSEILPDYPGDETKESMDYLLLRETTLMKAGLVDSWADLNRMFHTLLDHYSGGSNKPLLLVSFTKELDLVIERLINKEDPPNEQEKRALGEIIKLNEKRLLWLKLQDKFPENLYKKPS